MLGHGAPEWLRCGLVKDAVFTISAEAAQRRNLEDADSSPSEYGMTAAGLIGLLLSLAGRRARADKTRGKACLKEFLSFVLAGSEADDLMGEAATEEVYIECPARCLPNLFMLGQIVRGACCC